MVGFLLDNSLGAWWAARHLSEADLKNAESEEELAARPHIPGCAAGISAFRQTRRRRLDTCRRNL